jgi:hypothetical protein
VGERRFRCEQLGSDIGIVGMNQRPQVTLSSEEGFRVETQQPLRIA